MQINFSDISPGQRYGTMVQTIIPRPIAWVLSDNGQQSNGEHSYNLAPFSFFNGISSDPALLVLSIGKKDAETEKDTRFNIRQREHFVVHIPSMRHIKQVNQSSQTLAHGESEIKLAKLALSDFDGFSLPRLSDCNIAIACKLHRIDELNEMEQVLIIGEIVCVYINDEIVQASDNNRLLIDAMKLDPLSRLGGSQYGGLGQILSAERPK